MASITTILGTHSLSSSRLTINNNFDNVNEELGLIANVLDTTASTLLLTGNITSGTLNVINGSLSTFKVDSSSSTTDVEATFKKNVIFEKGHQISLFPTSSFPVGTPTMGAYVYDGGATNDIIMGGSNDGQTLIIIAKSAQATIDASNSAINGYTSTSTITINVNGSISLLGDSNGKWYIVGSHNATITL